MPHVLFAGKRCRPFIPDLGKVFLFIRNGEVCEGTLISAISISLAEMHQKILRQVAVEYSGHHVSNWPR